MRALVYTSCLRCPNCGWDEIKERWRCNLSWKLIPDAPHEIPEWCKSDKLREVNDE